MNKEFIDALNNLAFEKKLDKDQLLLSFEEALEQAVIDHCPGTITVLLGRLEYKHGGAVKFTVASKVLSGTEEHRGVTIMPAGVHLTLVDRAIFEGILFEDFECIHVRAQAD